MPPLEILTRTLYAEAGEEPVRAIEALAALILNRARLALCPGRPGGVPPAEAVAAACRSPFHFPCWNRRDARHARLLAPEVDSPAYAVCRRVALRALAGVLPDPTGGATHWHRAAAWPRWAIARVPVAQIGGLVFHRAAAAPTPASPARPRQVA
jgi:spore germination cell wall hydrolase CwlJ-like protein